MDDLWRNASRAQRVRAVAGGALVVWAAALVADMHYLRAKPEFKEKFPDAAEASVGELFGIGGDKEKEQEEPEEEPEWRKARREREERERAAQARAKAGDEPKKQAPPAPARQKDKATAAEADPSSKKG
jgi:hypothetical protein